MGRRSELFKQAQAIILFTMRQFLASLLLVTSADVPAQPPVWVPGMPWAPAAPYVTVGQDEAGYRNWYLASPVNPVAVKGLNDYLTTWQVSGVLPTWQLIRTASDWQKCGSPAFEVPPSADWPNVVQTLRYIRDQVIPAIGPVEAVSAYRNELLNQCAHGAVQSAHRFMQAVDLVPLRPITRDALIERMCAVHAQRGEPYGVGLGFYVGLRFHIDSRKFRTWGVNDEGGIACTQSYAMAHANDIVATPEPAASSSPIPPPPAQPPKP